MANTIKSRIQEHLKNENTGHGMDHAIRVMDLALKFSEKEGGDKDIIALTALCHSSASSWRNGANRNGSVTWNDTCKKHGQSPWEPTPRPIATGSHAKPARRKEDKTHDSSRSWYPTRPASASSASTKPSGPAPRRCLACYQKSKHVRIQVTGYSRPYLIKKRRKKT